MKMDLIRAEELRIMGFAYVGDPNGNLHEIMAKAVDKDGDVETGDGIAEAKEGDFLMEYPNGHRVLVPKDDFEASYTLVPLEVLDDDPGPSELAQPVGLLQRDEEKTDV